MIKNCLNYCLNLWNKAFKSRYLIFVLGVIAGMTIDLNQVFISIPIFIWIILFLGTIFGCCFLYAKYKINQDIFEEF